MSLHGIKLRCFVLFLLCLGGGAAPGLGQESATSIIRKSDQLMRGTTKMGVQRMTIVRSDWERTIEFTFWSQDPDKTFIRIQEPAKDRGVSFLKIGREMWQYVPNIHRTIKIPPSMMLQSWMGSDFTHDDLVKESSIVDDYIHERLGRERLNGDEVFVIELTPKPGAPITWGGILQWIRVRDYVPLKVVYFNERGEQVRTLLFSTFRAVNDRTVPMKVVLTRTAPPGQKTILETTEVTFNEPIAPWLFTRENLKRGR